MDLSLSMFEREKYILQLQNGIQKRKQLLIEKSKEIGELAKNNELLDDVKIEYSKYTNKTLMEKETQLEAFKILSRYLQICPEKKLMDLNIKAENSNNELNQIKREIHQIQNDINKIK